MTDFIETFYSNPLAIAESCTGGTIAERFTTNSGASSDTVGGNSIVLVTVEYSISYKFAIELSTAA